MNDSFACVYSFTFCGIHLKFLAMVSPSPKGRNGWVRNNTRFTQLGPLSPLLSVEWACQDLESESWWLPNCIWICCYVFSHSFLLAQDFPLSVSLPSDSYRYRKDTDIPCFSASRNIVAAKSVDWNPRVSLCLWSLCSPPLEYHRHCWEKLMKLGIS